MISIQAAVTTLLYVIIAGLIFGLLYWLVVFCELREPFNKFARIILAVLAVLVIIGILLSLVTGQPIFRP